MGCTDQAEGEVAVDFAPPGGPGYQGDQWLGLVGEWREHPPTVSLVGCWEGLRACKGPFQLRNPRNPAFL